MASFYSPIASFSKAPAPPRSVYFGALDLSSYIVGMGFDRHDGDVELLLSGFSHSFCDDLYLLYVRSSNIPQPLFFRGVAVLVLMSHYTQDIQAPNSMQPYAVTAIEGRVIRPNLQGITPNDMADLFRNLQLQRRLGG